MIQGNLIEGLVLMKTCNYFSNLDPAIDNSLKRCRGEYRPDEKRGIVKTSQISG